MHENMASFPVRGGIRMALFSVAGDCLSPTPCAVPINGLTFHVDSPHVVGGVCEPRILALRNYIYIDLLSCVWL